MNSPTCMVLFADSTTEKTPLGVSIGIVVFSLLAGAVGVIGLFQPSDKLSQMAGVIGTRNPVLARAVCVLTVLVSLGAVGVGSLAILGMF